MISGGQYSEDRESRIRSRFAIVSALSRSGYAPEDAEHLGGLTIPWPTQQEITRTKRDLYPHSSLWVHQSSAQTPSATSLLPLGISTPLRMDVHYEWYRRRTFIPRSTGGEVPSNVLVLWLDDSFFEDEPLLRLSLVLQPLWVNSDVMKVSLIGPRRSSTLRAMLPGDLAGKTPLWDRSQRIWPLVADVLQNVELFCATPSVMDDVLVTRTHNIPRKAVGEALEANGFKAFHNFAATDAQFAKELLNELALRKADVTKGTDNHLVLISEWDTFYARMQSLTYGTEMAVQQTNPQIGPGMSIRRFLIENNELPPNFHSLVYLRGLDGQTVAGEMDTKSDKDRPKAPTTSFEEFQQWVPDANKAEGQAQFDYLSRLGDQLEEIEDQARSRSRRAKMVVGIVGSDVYDTLLILQALRGRFPNWLFFTTDLDARFWHPRELSWSRNLIVISGYGLALHADLQGAIAPFRDSTQTAQFAAALAALGNSNLLNLTRVPPRRFEIGNNGPVDLSVLPGHLVRPVANRSTNETWLHPMSRYEAHATDAPMSWRRPFQIARRLLWRTDAPASPTPYDSVILALLGLGLSLALVSCYWRPLRTRILAFPRFLRMALLRKPLAIPAPESLEGKLIAIRRVRLVVFWVGSIGVLLLAAILARDIWNDTFRNFNGEPFSLTNGISAWPALILRVAAIVLAVSCCFILHSQLAITFYDLTGAYHLPLESRESPSFLKGLSDLVRRLPGRVRPFRESDRSARPVCVSRLWSSYYEGGHWTARLIRVSIACAIYYALSRVIFQLFGSPSQPLRGDVTQSWVKLQIAGWTLPWYMLVNLTFFFLTFLTIDAARLCHRFVERISDGRAKFPKQTREHFQEQRGRISGDYLDEWIGTRLIADLTDRVGRLLWFPSLVLLLLLTARLPFWDRWPWHTAHIIMMVLNITLALASVLILQAAARQAKNAAEERLTEKIARLRAETAPSPTHNNAAQAEKLLDEIRDIHHGAFVPFWENPVLGALLVGPGGLSILQIIVWSFTR
ncbi:MAG TPA: hypothetical protein VJS65_12125, partial [Verrucomicrobiae bacterium]|nr:hypothetical protein [Verrucomicrobiae bacterium]